MDFGDSRDPRWAAKLAGLACCLALAAPVRADSPLPTLDPDRVGWTALTYHASKLGIKTTSDVTLVTVPEAKGRAGLIEPAEHEALEPSGAVGLLDVSSRFLGRQSASRIWFDPRTGTTFQRRGRESGKRNRLKINRFTPAGVFTVRKYPRKGEEKGGVEGWTDVSDTFYPYPRSFATVIEPGVLFYLVAAADLTRQGQRLESVFFTRNDVAVAELQVSGRERIRARYDERSASGQRTTTGEVDTIKIAVRPVEVADSSTRIELIGLQGDIDIFVHPQLRIPILISGKAKYVGHVDVHLRSVTLADER